MINVAPEVAGVLREALNESGVGRDRGLRLTMDIAGWKLELDSPRANDRVIRDQDSVVLIVAPEAEAAVGDAVVDIERHGDADLVLRRRAFAGVGLA